MYERQWVFEESVVGRTVVAANPVGEDVAGQEGMDSNRECKAAFSATSGAQNFEVGEGRRCRDDSFEYKTSALFNLFEQPGAVSIGVKEGRPAPPKKVRV